MTDFAALVFHVLAHVRLSSPASCFEPAYVQWCAERLGPATQRELGHDAAVLERVLQTDEAATTVQLLALLFPDGASASAASSRDLLQIREEIRAGVAQAAGVALSFAEFQLGLLERLLPMGAALEVLRMACELERRHLALLPPPSPAANAALMDALQSLAGVAPLLAAVDVRELRPLWRRGRVVPSYGDWRRAEIWVGSACADQGPGLRHVAWQACHEASVVELSRAWALNSSAEPGAGVGYPAAIEHAALVLLEERVAKAERQPHGLGVGGREAWDAWRGHLARGLPRGINDLRGAAQGAGDPQALGLAQLVEQLARDVRGE